MPLALKIYHMPLALKNVFLLLCELEENLPADKYIQNKFNWF